MLPITSVFFMFAALCSASGYRYEAFSDLVNFADAQASCTAKGGELALPDSAAEAADIAAAVADQDEFVDWSSTAFSHLKFYWLNIEEDENDKPLTELSYTNYFKTQPNRASEKCVGAASARGGRWSDRPCDALSPYVCQYEHTDLKCYKNKKGHLLTSLEKKNDVLDKHNYKKRENAVIKCEIAAQEAGGYSFFAVGNGGQCFAGHGEDYTKFGQVKLSKNCPEHGKGKYAVINVYKFVEEREPETTTTTTTTTTEPTHACGAGRCKDRSEYCSSSKCKPLRAKGKFCSSDRQCLSKDCTWYLTCK